MTNQIHDQNSSLWASDFHVLQKSLMYAFLEKMHAKKYLSSKDWDSLYQWSIDDLENFWDQLSQFVQIKFHRSPELILDSGDSMRTTSWFKGAKLNFAENLLPEPNKHEILACYAEGTPRSSWTGLQLWNDVASCAAALKKQGVKPNDCVAGVLINGPEAIICMLATASIGAIWSSCSPDFGANGIKDRLNQVSPRVLFATKSYQYAGKLIDNSNQVNAAVKELDQNPRVIFVDHFKRGQDEFSDWLNGPGLDRYNSLPLPMKFESRNFSDPQYILFSSGTTGLPKCITHGVGGTLLQHKKELMLHSDIKIEDTLFYFTTCGWMMWNWMVSALSCGAKIVTFDGAPTFPEVNTLWKVCADEGVTHFGTSPKFLSVCSQNSEFYPEQLNQLQKLRVILSTGSPLLPAHFSWVYKHFPNIHLASISGGTDIISCFMLGNPLLPVYSGEIQAPGLGMAIESWNEEQKPVRNERGELVCVKPFVSMPVCFWNDESGVKYHKAYFEFYKSKDVWRHGDFIEITDHGGIIVYGRSDATLNPGGVRIGTAEIYRAIETLPFLEDSLAIGQVKADDTRIILFAKLRRGFEWSAEIEKQIKAKIRSELSPRHVPAVVLPVQDIPYTRSGKKIELAVTHLIHGESVQNITAIANPESLKEYERLRELL